MADNTSQERNGRLESEVKTLRKDEALARSTVGRMLRVRRTRVLCPLGTPDRSGYLGCDLPKYARHERSRCRCR